MIGLNYYPQTVIPGSQHPKKTSNPTLNFFAVIFIAVILLGLLWSGLSPLQVTYKITGSASQVFLTYENGQGGTEHTEVGIP